MPFIFIIGLSRVQGSVDCCSFRILFRIFLCFSRENIMFSLRWLEIFALLNLDKSVLNCSCILTYFLSNYGSFDDQCSIAMATLAYEICLKTVDFAA